MSDEIPVPNPEQPVVPVKRGRGRPRKVVAPAPVPAAPAEIPVPAMEKSEEIPVPANNFAQLEEDLSMAESPEAMLAAAKKLAEMRAAQPKPEAVPAAAKPEIQELPENREIPEIPKSVPATPTFPQNSVPANPVPAAQIPPRSAFPQFQPSQSSFQSSQNFGHSQSSYGQSSYGQNSSYTPRPLPPQSAFPRFQPSTPMPSAINPLPRNDAPASVPAEQHYPMPSSVPEKRLPSWAQNRQPAPRFSPRPSPYGATQQKPGYKKPYAPAPRFQERPVGPNYTKFSYKDSTERPQLKLGEKYDLNRLNDEKYLEQLAQRALHLKKLVRREVPSAIPNNNPNDPFARPEITNLREELIDDVPAEPISFNDFYTLPHDKLLKVAQSLEVKNAASLRRTDLILNIIKESYVHRRPVEVTGTLDLTEGGDGLLLYRCDNYMRVEFTAFVPAILIQKYNLQRGHLVTGIAFPAMPGETAPMIVDVKQIEGRDPAEIAAAPKFSELVPCYPTRRIKLECPELSEKGNAAMRAIDLVCPIGYGQRMLINVPEGFDKAPLMHALLASLSKNVPDAEITTLMIDCRGEDIAEFKHKTPENIAIVASDFWQADETHIHIAELTVEHARRRAELGLHTVIVLDSLTRLARAYNMLRSNGQKFVSDTIDILTLTKPKHLFSSACCFSNGGSITIIAALNFNTPNKANEVIFEEFSGTQNAKLTLMKKAEFPHIDILNSTNRRETLLVDEAELALTTRIRKNMSAVPAPEALEALMNDIKATTSNEELAKKIA